MMNEWRHRTSSVFFLYTANKKCGGCTLSPRPREKSRVAPSCRGVIAVTCYKDYLGLGNRSVFYPNSSV